MIRQQQIIQSRLLREWDNCDAIGMDGYKDVLISDDNIQINDDIINSVEIEGLEKDVMETIEFDMADMNHSLMFPLVMTRIIKNYGYERENVRPVYHMTNNGKLLVAIKDNGGSNIGYANAGYIYNEILNKSSLIRGAISSGALIESLIPVMEKEGDLWESDYITGSDIMKQLMSEYEYTNIANKRTLMFSNGMCLDQILMTSNFGLSYIIQTGEEGVRSCILRINHINIHPLFAMSLGYSDLEMSQHLLAMAVQRGIFTDNFIDLNIARNVMQIPAHANTIMCNLEYMTEVATSANVAFLYLKRRIYYLPTGGGNCFLLGKEDPELIKVLRMIQVHQDFEVVMPMMMRLITNITCALVVGSHFTANFDYKKGMESLFNRMPNFGHELSLYVVKQMSWMFDLYNNIKIPVHDDYVLKNEKVEENCNLDSSIDSVSDTQHEEVLQRTDCRVRDMKILKLNEIKDAIYQAFSQVDKDYFDIYVWASGTDKMFEYDSNYVALTSWLGRQDGLVFSQVDTEDVLRYIKCMVMVEFNVVFNRKERVGIGCGVYSDFMVYRITRNMSHGFKKKDKNEIGYNLRKATRKKIRPYLFKKCVLIPVDSGCLFIPEVNTNIGNYLFVSGIGIDGVFNYNFNYMKPVKLEVLLFSPKVQYFINRLDLPNYKERGEGFSGGLDRERISDAYRLLKMTECVGGYERLFMELEGRHLLGEQEMVVDII